MRHSSSLRLADKNVDTRARMGAPVSKQDAYSLYVSKVGRCPLPDPDAQLRHAKRMDRYLRLASLSVLRYPAILDIVVRDIGQGVQDGRLKRIVARHCPQDSAEMPIDHADEKVKLTTCMERIRQLAQNRTQQSQGELRVCLSAVRFTRDYLESLTAHVKRPDGVHDGVTEKIGVGADMHSYGVFITRLLGRVNDCVDYLVQANQRLVMALARQYRYSPIPFMDLVQEGNIGILRAAERFDPYRDTRFTTYASWWVRRAMVYAIARQGHLVQPSVTRFWEARKITRGLDKLEIHLGHKPSQSEAAQELGLSSLDITGARESLAPALSLDVPMSADNDTPLIDRLHTDVGNVESAMAHEDDRRIVSKLLEGLPLRHANILRMRFGIGVYESCTLEEIAQQQGVTRERIRQIEAQALHMIRQSIDPRILAEYFL